MYETVRHLMTQAEQDCRPVFEALEQREKRHTQAVLDAFRRQDVGSRHFAPTTGYGYDDIGRDTLERITADIFHAEAAIMRPHLVSGTAALYAGLSGLLLPGDEMLSATGLPYDTMQTVLGLSGNAPGNLREMGVRYRQAELAADGTVDEAAVLEAIGEKTKLVFFQRSRGYAWRPGLLPADMKRVFASVRAKSRK